MSKKVSEEPLKSEVKSNEQIKTLPFITQVPENAIELTVAAVLLNDDGSKDTAVMKLNFSDIREGFVKGEEWMDNNGNYVLTEKAKEMLGIK
jgi:hypothetical protein